MNGRNNRQVVEIIQNGQCVLGIEFGSTRIKAVLIGPDHHPLASGGFNWENSLQDGWWTYPLEEVWRGLQSCFADLQQKVSAQYGVALTKLQALGISGMMHGYLVLDADGKPLTSFRTWRNNRTGVAAETLTSLLNYPIPQRWSIAHLYQAILDGEAHVGRIAHLTTLAGYVHWQLSGQKVMGIGEASGMFPVDLQRQDFDVERMNRFDLRVLDKKLSWKLKEILPRVLRAGEPAGELTAEGALRLDPSGALQAGVPLCPPEGDAGTGMVATNSIRVRTGNVSAGTSVFAMLVLEKELAKVHSEIDLVTTPDGHLVAMAHSNNCMSDTDAWLQLLGEAAAALGAEFPVSDLYDKLLGLALEGDPDCGGLMSYGYVSGEHLTGFSEGRPLFVRSPHSRFTLANFMRSHLFTSLCALRTGLNILTGEEGVVVDEIRGHGGFFKTAEVGERIMAAATGVPVALLQTAGEGGAWGIALLAAYRVRQQSRETLADFLQRVFAGSQGTSCAPDPSDVAGFETFFRRYQQGLPIERAAVESLT